MADNDRTAPVTFQRALRDRVSALPGVTAQGAITLPPLIGSLARIPFTVEGRMIEPEQVPMAQFRFVSAGYFEALRIPVTRGRTFSDRDTAHTSPVAVLNEALAKRWLDRRDPATFIQVTVVVAVAALFAAGVPSLRAVRTRHVNIQSE